MVFLLVISLAVSVQDIMMHVFVCLGKMQESLFQFCNGFRYFIASPPSDDGIVGMLLLTGTCDVAICTSTLFVHHSVCS